MRRLRALAPAGLASLAGLACVLCCAIPALIAAGIIGGGWAAFGHVLPGIAVVLVALAGGAWWWAGRRRNRHTDGCAGEACSCASG